MTELLSADLFRMRRSKLFWACLLLTAAAGAWQPFCTYMEYERTYPLDTSLFVYTMLTGLLLSVFLPLFFGSEYSDGAIRNKLIAGHSRTSIYLSRLSSAILASLTFCGTWLLSTLVVGIPLLGLPVSPSRLLMVTLLLSLLLAAAWCAIFTVITMVSSRKSASAVICILLYLAVFMFATWLFAQLDAPEFYPGYEFIDGEMLSEMIRNPAYLQPGARRVYEFLFDLVPMGQAIQLIDISPARPVQMALCSLGIIATTTAAGTALFQRKDLK